MVVASIYGTAFIVVGIALALWSLWWIIAAARTNIDEREAEVAAREAVGRGEAWADQNGSAPQPFSDEEIAELAASLEPVDPADAGIDVRRAPDPKGRRGRRS